MKRILSPKTKQYMGLSIKASKFKNPLQDAVSNFWAAIRDAENAANDARNVINDIVKSDEWNSYDADTRDKLLSAFNDWNKCQRELGNLVQSQITDKFETRIGDQLSILSKGS